MIKIKDNYVAYIIIFSFIFAFPFFSYAQNIANNVKPVLIAAAEVTKQTIKKENPSANEVNPKKEDSSFSILIPVIIRYSQTELAKKNKT